MGAGASFERKIYKRIECGCIYCYSYNKNKIQLLCPCYMCIGIIRLNKYSTQIPRKLANEVRDKDEEEIIEKNIGWVSEAVAIEEAHNRGMKCIDEFICNSDILERNNIYY
jgi:hypothetical protein